MTWLGISQEEGIVHKEEAVKQPKTFIWGLRDYIFSGMKLKVWTKLQVDYRFIKAKKHKFT